MPRIFSMHIQSYPIWDARKEIVVKHLPSSVWCCLGSFQAAAPALEAPEWNKIQGPPQAASCVFMPRMMTYILYSRKFITMVTHMHINNSSPLVCLNCIYLLFQGCRLRFPPLYVFTNIKVQMVRNIYMQQLKISFVWHHTYMHIARSFSLSPLSMFSFQDTYTLLSKYSVWCQLLVTSTDAAWQSNLIKWKHNNPIENCNLTYM